MNDQTLTMNSKQILLLVQSLSHEKGLAENDVLAALEFSLAAVIARHYTDDVDIRLSIDRETGEPSVFRRWEVLPDDCEQEVDELGEPRYVPARHLLLANARQETEDAELDVGVFVEDPIEMMAFGRIEVQQVRQLIMQKVREAERQKIAADYSKKVGELVFGTVKRVTREFILLDLGNNAEGLLDRKNILPREIFRVNDRLRAYLYEVSEDIKRGPCLHLTRTANEFLIALFKIEVPEINEEIVEVKAAARDPGMRAKIAVKTNDGRIDPIGACVGMRGSRVQAVSNELNGERVDIVLWDDSPAKLVMNAMAPAEVSSLVVDEEKHSMDVVVEQEQLSQAIGRGGQNVILASQLTGWSLNIMTAEQVQEKHEQESDHLKQMFMEKLEIDDVMADILVAVGFSKIAEIAFIDPQELLSTVEEFDESIVEELQSRANELVLLEEVNNASVQPAEDLLTLEGMSEELANRLADQGIITREDLAEQSIDDLNDKVELDSVVAGELIMKAREHWFAEE